ncbi:helix-turn-helix transcriptional regulator [Angustibacter sp. McL0619]|uniref:helix-turn-helix transcriptional regulator n=1 Tax=Angustibacter sp. McL0619 TaxID=3415676 RepID=UPI003CF1BD6B
MPKRAVAVSRASRDALAVLGSQVKKARLVRGWTQAELAGRIGVDARTLSAVEAGSPNVAIGTAFNAAFTAGVNLFGLDGDELALARRRGEETLALLPKQARAARASQDGDDDF